MPPYPFFLPETYEIQLQLQYVPGKHQVTADTLSCAPAGLPGLDNKLLVSLPCQSDYS